MFVFKKKAFDVKHKIVLDKLDCHGRDTNTLLRS